MFSSGCSIPYLRNNHIRSALSLALSAVAAAEDFNAKYCSFQHFMKKESMQNVPWVVCNRNKINSNECGLYADAERNQEVLS
jgi:hypothetical protein